MNTFQHFFKIFLLAITAASCFISTTQADEVAIPVGQQGSDKAAVERPKVGTTTEKVEAKFGAPLKKSSAVGKPPISTWDYPAFSVYFESDRVIHSVLKANAVDSSAPVAAPAADPVTAPALDAEPAPASTVDTSPTTNEPTPEAGK